MSVISRVFSFPRVTASAETISRKTTNVPSRPLPESEEIDFTVRQNAESVMSAIGESAMIGR